MFGEVVNLEDKALVSSGKAGDDFREQAVFPERVVVEMPDVGRAAERVGGGGAEGVG